MALPARRRRRVDGAAQPTQDLSLTNRYLHHACPRCYANHCPRRKRGHRFPTGPIPQGNSHAHTHPPRLAGFPHADRPELPELGQDRSGRKGPELPVLLLRRQLHDARREGKAVRHRERRLCDRHHGDEGPRLRSQPRRLRDLDLADLHDHATNVRRKEDLSRRGEDLYCSGRGSIPPRRGPCHCEVVQVLSSSGYLLSPSSYSP